MRNVVAMSVGHISVSLRMKVKTCQSVTMNGHTMKPRRTVTAKASTATKVMPVESAKRVASSK